MNQHTEWVPQIPEKYNTVILEYDTELYQTDLIAETIENSSSFKKNLRHKDHMITQKYKGL